MLKTTLVFLIGLAAANASAQSIVRLQEAPHPPTESHTIQIDTNRGISMQHVRSGETVSCEESCLLRMAEAEYSLQLHGRLIRPPSARRLVVDAPERLVLRVRSRRGWRIFGGILAATLGGAGMAMFAADATHPCRDEPFCFRGLGMAIGGALSVIGLTVGIGLMFTRDRVEFVRMP